MRRQSQIDGWALCGISIQPPYFDLPSARGQMAEGTRYRANHCTLHTAQGASCPAALTLGGGDQTSGSPGTSGKDPALALSLAGFGRMTAWRPGSFVKAAAHFERATTCLTRSLSMFRLVGVRSRPDLLAVVVCAKSTKLAVTLAQGGGGMVYCCLHHPVLFWAEARPGRTDLHPRAPSQWPRWRLKSAPSLRVCRLYRSNNSRWALGSLAALAADRRGSTPFVALHAPVQATNDLRPALRSETAALRPRLAVKRSRRPGHLQIIRQRASNSGSPIPNTTVPGKVCAQAETRRLEG